MELLKLLLVFGLLCKTIDAETIGQVEENVSFSVNQPWAINDHLSYGFAAAYIEGQDENDWCWGCYELSFTSGPVVGKRMIVQVTNTLEALGPVHFDIQMPGGGVGGVNGCAPQWSPPYDGWGEQFGGVSNITQCDQLPEELQSGCRWRFQWFEDANNPDFTFIPFECPIEITLRSGYIRV
ncbi:endoglucanase-5-like [Bradysia coprophila]|uniref:endoglucanase-5-like n=1 Tax=Bradysia coprophila TaxID=38358 RepID=UPI00187DC8AD|nr:endoglucanase-5-like [Bradysia coprophila]